jgi:cytosine/adenosine deaminase-related metal-dependent hydrolase
MRAGIRLVRYNVPDMPRSIALPIALRARLVFPIAAPPIVDGCVTIVGEKIVAVGRADDEAAHIDLGEVALLPGLVNAHTHLEFADVAAPLGEPGMSLPEWIREVMAHRRAGPVSRAHSVHQGLQACMRTGTTTLGDIATHDWRADLASEGEWWPEVVMFREAIAPTVERIAPVVSAAEALLSSPDRIAHIHPALSPHAPYTVHPELLDSMVEMARRHQVPLAMHLAESREELELLRSGGGPFRELLVELNAWNPAPDARLGSIRAYLERLARAPRALVIHGNYLNADEREFLVEQAASLSVVYCPRTHAFFNHEPYPLAELLLRGVRVALGTDSRASNPDLDMWREIRFVAQQHPGVSPETVLQLATLAGAQALGLESHIGTLEAGKAANLAIVALNSSDADPHERLLWGDSRVVANYLRGKPIGDLA